jgi:UDP-N-acetylmuramoyl-tripeptide--D-alanyl-D-alanine ligase
MGFQGAADLGLEGTTLYWEELQIRFPLIGQHNLLNALGALTLTAAMGIAKDAIRQGLEAVQPLFGRSQVERGELTIIKDYYNANPASMAAALEFFFSLPWQGRKLLVLGSMLALGVSHRRLRSRR